MLNYILYTDWILKIADVAAQLNGVPIQFLSWIYLDCRTDTTHKRLWIGTTILNLCSLQNRLL